MSLDHRRLVQLARLARLELDPVATNRLLEDLSRVLAYFSVIDGFDPGAELPVTEERGRLDSLRADRAEVTVSQSEAISCAPEVEGGEFIVPAVVQRGANESGEV